MFNDLMQQPVQSVWGDIDPLIFATIQQVAQMSAVGSQMALQQQGQAQAVGPDQVAAQTTVQ